MGRGRQKAKQTKVARELKYWSPETDYSALEQELRSGGHPKGTSYDPTESYAPDEDYDEKIISKYVDWPDDEEDDANED